MLLDQNGPSYGPMNASDSAANAAPTAGSNGIPAIALPKGGGAIRGIGEKFAANPVSGTGSMTVPIATSAGRSGFGPQLSLSYDSGAGNGPFGMGWGLRIPSIARKTDKGLPLYRDAEDSDVFLLAGVEDLVPLLRQDTSGAWLPEELPPRIVAGTTYRIRRYRPRIEGVFALIERWTSTTEAGNTFWRSVSKDNVTAWYGRNGASRIADPEHPERIFEWLLCLSYDDKGNVIRYEYKPENGEDIDLSQARERNRGTAADKRRTANRYPKRILYGNRFPFLPKLTADQPWPEPTDGQDWLFEVVFDYGEHHSDTPTPQDTGIWPARQDQFSTYRSTFEIRTRRLCQRVLMFHHFPDQPDGQKGYDGLARSTDFSYESLSGASTAPAPGLSKLIGVTQRSYQLASTETGYLTASLPPIEFTYSEAKLQTELRELRDDSLTQLPIGIDGTRYQWVDLEGEGIPGILAEQANAWFYKPNLSPLNAVTDEDGARLEAKFAPAMPVSPKPNLPLSAGQGQFLDLGGEGRMDAVRLAGPVPGYYGRTKKGLWDSFVPFESMPNVNWDDPNLRFIDLDGDGLADILIGEQDAFVWHRSLGQGGFDSSRRIGQEIDEENGPQLVFADREESVYLSDMSGDGLSDIVRIRNGQISYWPNLGHGRFGGKVTMDQAPLFDHADQFDQRRIRLADIDGSGTTDVLYLHRDGVHAYFNQSGNSWSEVAPIPHLPPVDNLANVLVLDLLGNGTACLVWSSPSSADSRRPMRYLDLMGGMKPHLLIKTVNNLGNETAVEYAPSTKFYLLDQQAGRPWITKLPFPVHCVEKVTVHDKWRQTTFTSSYSYHHGYFDGAEREFRGFGRVDQIDTEDYGKFSAGHSASPYVTDDKILYQPPVQTVTWYHTGAFQDRERALDPYKNEFFSWRRQSEEYGGGGEAEFYELSLPEPDLDALDLSAVEWREALRACKGMVIRQETYELDVDALAANAIKPVKLFTAAYHNCHIRLVQPKAVNPHAVFLVAESEAITYRYEMDLRPDKALPDPRIEHTLNLSIDEYGNVQQALTVHYPRLTRYSDSSVEAAAQDLIGHVQSELRLTYTETHYTNDVMDSDQVRLRLPYESKSYELSGLRAQGPGQYFSLNELRGYKLCEIYQDSGLEVEEIAYHQLPDVSGDRPQKRIAGHTRSLYFDVTLDKPLALGQLNGLALPYESYKLLFTADHLNLVYPDKLKPHVWATLSDRQSSGYLTGGVSDRLFGMDTSGEYWTGTGVAGYRAVGEPIPFYLPDRFEDPFGNRTEIVYDACYLYVKSHTDALGNRKEVTAFDYRLMAPSAMRDENDNVSEVRFDIRGMPAATAMLGKGDEADNLQAYDESLLNPDISLLQAWFVENDYNIAEAARFLRDASVRHLYTFGEAEEEGKTVWGRHPACTCSLARERHAADSPDSPIRCGFQYSDGSGNVVVTKAQAEPERAGGPLRWVVSGKTVLNNKGNPVKQYEPYFSALSVGHRFEEPVETGVTPITYYDALGRAIRTEMPDGTYNRIEFSPWLTVRYDANDTIAEAGNAWYAARSSQDASLEDRRAARLAADHAGTPSVAALDGLGREVVTIVHNRAGSRDALVDEKYVTFTRLNAQGLPLWVQDARGNRVTQYLTPPLADGSYPFNDPGNYRLEGFAPCYDIGGSLLFQYEMDAGGSWFLNDAAGSPLFAWNSRSIASRTTYDTLRRPLGSYVTGVDPADPAREVQVGKWIYGEEQADDKMRNLRGKPCEQFDTAGLVLTESYDFKGNPVRMVRQFAADYKSAPDWSAESPQSPDLEAERFITATRYDALNRPTQIVAPYSTTVQPKRLSVTQPAYNEAGLLERVDVWINRPAEPVTLLAADTADRSPVRNLDYNAKGQRLRAQYGNGAVTEYAYDPDSFRLKRIQTTRGSDRALLQDLRITYDPIGNLVQIQDHAHDRVFHANSCVTPGAEYRYDALYRLIAAGGREHKGNGGAYDWELGSRTTPTLPNDCQALRNYVETYAYDKVGNLMRLVHHAGRSLRQPGQAIWNRHYQYARGSNRLLSTSLPGDPDQVPEYSDAPGYGAAYAYDAGGNMTAMPHLPRLSWNFRDQLESSMGTLRNDSPSPDLTATTYYVYDSAGQRLRKVTETPNGVLRKQRIYLDGFEVYREYGGDGTVTLERESLHVLDDKRRVALIETLTVEGPTPLRNLQPLVRYQLGNHLGSINLELDDNSAVISYEEYTPYGSTAYCAGRSAAEVGLKRYRYTGQERDEETGFSYHGARYYAPWLARWISTDPIGLNGGINGYAYVNLNPVKSVDPGGTEDAPPEPKRESTAMILLKVGFRMAFTHITHQTPEHFAQGWTEKAASISVDPVMKIYGPDGMLDKAAQKKVDQWQGLPERDYVTKAEHAEQLEAIFQVGGTLFPGFGEVFPGMKTPGPALVTPEGALVSSSGSVAVPGTNGAVQVATALASTGGGKATAPKEPGEWEDDLANGNNMTKEQAQYQKQITGKPVKRTYYVNGRSFDGYIPGKGGSPGTLLEAKHLADDGRFAKAFRRLMNNDFSEYAYLRKRVSNREGTGIVDQARAQVRAARGTGARIEWHVSGESATEALRMLFDNVAELRGRIDVIHTPLK